jgi:diguanylate cyclase (GGDEF)-like protein/PAS domain S-box-containing protein
MMRASIASKYPLQDHIEIPGGVLASWQITVNILAELAHIPSALIMRVHPREIEVFVSSHSAGNVYEKGEQASLDTGLYCETVMTTRQELLVPDARNDPVWDHNPDIELGMISYLGLPLIWPGGEIFGTICILDEKYNAYSDTYRSLLERFRDSIQLNLETIYRNIQQAGRLQQAEEHIHTLSQAIDQSPVSVVILDTEGKIEYTNRGFERITGYNAPEVMGKYPSLLKSEYTPTSLNRELWQSISNGITWEGEFLNQRKNGEVFWEYAHIAPVLDANGRLRHYIAVGTDITKQKQQEKQLQYQANFDALTDLPNRFLSMDRLTQLINEGKRSKKRIAVLFLDLDDFKKINDSLGHEAGDQLLIQAASRLKDTVRIGDTVGRLGGDEFIVLLGGLKEPTDARSMAENLLSRFRAPFLLNDRELFLTVSVGIALYPDDGDTPVELLRNADTAMYHSKDHGRNMYHYFTDAMNREVYHRLQLEEQLHGALQRGEFFLRYQPLVNVGNHTLIGVEALLRWNNPKLGTVPPMEFVPIAERTGLILEIGEYVITTAIQQLSQWQRQFNRGLKMALNLSPRQFRDANLAPFVEHILRKNSVSPGLLKLEITEGVLMSGRDCIDDTLMRLNKLGVALVMDDFGTGYSSLSYLRDYPFDILKIDRSFINDITEDVADQELVNASIDMGHGLGLEVVAEGVETEGQLAYLADRGCDYVQGYLFGKPQAADAITKLMTSNPEYITTFNPGIDGIVSHKQSS